MQLQKIKPILCSTAFLLMSYFLKAQISFYPEVAYGISNAKAIGSTDNYGQYPLNGTKSSSYYHLGVLAKINFKNSNFFITTGFVAHFYYVNYLFNRSVYSPSPASSRELALFKGFPVILNYDINPTKKQSLILSAGLKYSVTNPQSKIGGKSEIAGIAAIGYKFNNLNVKLFYMNSLNDVGRYPAVQSIKFNAFALSANILMYAGRNKQEAKNN